MLTRQSKILSPIYDYFAADSRCHIDVTLGGFTPYSRFSTAIRAEPSQPPAYARWPRASEFLGPAAAFDSCC